MISYEFRLRPNNQQEALLLKTLRLTRELYNQGLQELIEHYRNTGKHLNHFAHDKLQGKEQHPDIPAVLVDTTIKRLHHSFANFLMVCGEAARSASPDSRGRTAGIRSNSATRPATALMLLFRVTKSTKLRIMAQRNRTASFPRLTKVAILR
jgi:hypothetical protein